MKKSRKAGCIVAGVCIIVGAVLTGAGLAMGGNLSNGFSIRGNFLDIDSWSFNNHSRSTNETKKITVDAFKSLDIDINSGDVEIIQGDEYAVFVENAPEDEYTIIQENNVLTIKQRNKHQFNIGFDFDDFDYKYTITVPASMKEVKVDSNMGDVFIMEIEAKEMFVYQSMGDIELKNINIEKVLKTEQSMGKIEFDGVCAGDMDFTNSMGDTDISMRGNEDDYQYELSTSMGDIEVNGRQHGDGMNASYGNGRGTRKITVDNSMGDISLEFR